MRKLGKLGASISHEIYEGYVFAIPQERNRYIVTLVRDRPQWLKKNVGRWRRIEDVQQEAAPLVLPAESEVDLGAEPAEPNGQTSFRGVRDNGDASPQDAASAVTLVAATVTNWTTKAEVLSCARAAIEAGEDRRNVTELLAIAQNDFHATQREIAAAVGRSARWEPSARRVGQVQGTQSVRAHDEGRSYRARAATDQGIKAALAQGDAPQTCRLQIFMS